MAVKYIEVLQYPIFVDFEPTVFGSSLQHNQFFDIMVIKVISLHQEIDYAAETQN